MKEEPIEGEKEQKTKKRYGKILLSIFLALFALLVISYGALMCLALNKSLPQLMVGERNVGLKDEAEAKKAVLDLNATILNKNLKIKSEKDEVEKTYRDYGLVIEPDKTTDSVMNAGKYKNIFPTFSYLKNVALKGKMGVEPAVSWAIEADKDISDAFPTRSQDPQNAKFELDGDNLKITGEQNGFELDFTKIKKDIEWCFLNNCQTGILARSDTKPAQIKSADLESFKQGLTDSVNLGLILAAEEKNRDFSLSKEDILGFFDYGKAVASHTISWSDQAIEDYLNGIGKKINVKGRNRQISTYDNSVISEGTEGYGLQVDSSRDAVINGLNQKEKVVTLKIGTTPVEDEYIGPGFVPNRVAGKYIDVNLTEQMLYTVEGDKLIDSYRVSTGKWSMPTPVGEFAINNKDPRAYSATYNLYMPYWMAFIGSDYGIHELPEWPNGTKEGENHLGTPVSHGCIRLGVGSAETVYNWAETGTPVFTHM